jgi:putative ATP-dependent endonuclease of the OLD family
LKDLYADLKQNFPDLPNETIKDKMRGALRSFEEQHPELCDLQASDVKFYGFSSGDDKLNKYIQWVYVPAVRDVGNENVDRKTTALGKLLRYTVKATTNFEQELSDLRVQTKKQYSDLIEKKQDVLTELSKSLTGKLSAWAHPGATATLKWAQDDGASVRIEEPTIKMYAGEGGFEGEITRFGNGFQRSYLLAVLQELASVTNAGAGPTLLLGCEEPELFQHPPQARHLAHVFQSLSEANTQIIVTTHSPHFVFGRHFESVRMVRRSEGLPKATVTSSRIVETAKRIASARDSQVVLPVGAAEAKLQQALQPRLSEMFFADRVVLVEGIEDVAYLTSWLIAKGQWEHCRKEGMHIVPVDGKGNFVEPLVLCAELKIPHYLIYDPDSDAKPDHKPEHEKDNKALLHLLGQVGQPSFPTSTILTKTHAIWQTDIGGELRQELGQQRYDKAIGAARKKLDKPNGNWTKNPVFIGEFVAAIFADANKPACSMDRLCDWLVKFCGN